MQIPILADTTKAISASYGVLLERAGVALRGLFIINPQVELCVVVNAMSMSTAHVPSDVVQCGWYGDVQWSLVVYCNCCGLDIAAPEPVLAQCKHKQIHRSSPVVCC